MNSSNLHLQPVENLVKNLPDSELFGRNRMLLKDQIQSLYNKIQYDYSLSQEQKDQLRESMLLAELDLEVMEEGKEVSNG